MQNSCFLQQAPELELKGKRRGKMAPKPWSGPCFRAARETSATRGVFCACNQRRAVLCILSTLSEVMRNRALPNETLLSL